MVKKECFTEKYIRTKRNELKIVDYGLYEKALYAFELLGGLAEYNLNFIFKGGTSLMLHISEPKRLSIDIDILCSENSDKLLSILEKIKANSPFLSFEENERGYRGLPNRRHFKFFYNSVISKRQECVLLDVVEESECALPIEKKEIKSIFFDTDSKTTVQIPTVEGLLGDKLTAFAPNTVGIPFFLKNNDEHFMQVVKQMFDIGQLFDIAKDFQNVGKAYNSSFQLENKYKGEIYSREQALDDSAETALALCQMNLKGGKTDIGTYLADGITRLNSHLINSKFRYDIEGKIAAAKVYMLSNMIKSNSFDFLMKYGIYNQSELQMNLIKNSSTTSLLGKLKAINPETFYYLILGDLTKNE